MPGLVRQLYRSCRMRNPLALYGVRVVNPLLPLVVIPYLARVLELEGWSLVAFAQALAMYCIITIEHGFEYPGTRASAPGPRGSPGSSARSSFSPVVARAALVLCRPAPARGPVSAALGRVFAVLQVSAPLW
ncbi:MAG: oligosaccharide flippase family protein [Geminicoccaceae bacterium]